MAYNRPTLRNFLNLIFSSLFFNFLFFNVSINGVSCQSYNDQSTTLYVTDPSCASYKCQVIKHHGDQLYINWLNAPPGDVKLVLASEKEDKTYTINPKIAGTQDNCNHGDNGKRPCGKFTAVISPKWAYGKYSVNVISLSTGQIGYTDTVIIAKKPSNSRIRRTSS